MQEWLAVQKQQFVGLALTVLLNMALGNEGKNLQTGVKLITITVKCHHTCDQVWKVLDVAEDWKIHFSEGTINPVSLSNEVRR